MLAQLNHLAQYIQFSNDDLSVLRDQCLVELSIDDVLPLQWIDGPRHTLLQICWPLQRKQGLKKSDPS